MSVLEIVLYIAIGLAVAIYVIKSIVDIKKKKRKSKTEEQLEDEE